MIPPQKLNETRDNATLDNLLDGRVLLLGEQLAELGGCIKLTLLIVRKDICNHARRELIAFIVSKAQWLVNKALPRLASHFPQPHHRRNLGPGQPRGYDAWRYSRRAFADESRFAVLRDDGEVHLALNPPCF